MNKAKRKKVAASAGKVVVTGGLLGLSVFVPATIPLTGLLLAAMYGQNYTPPAPRK